MRKKTTIIFLVLFLVMVFIRITPTIKFPGGFRIFVIESGSMLPALEVNSIIVSHPESIYKVGDIITYYDPQSNSKYPTITHRVQEVINKNGEIFYMTKGDANILSDGQFIKSDKVVGKVIKNYPFLGLIINVTRSGLGFIFFILIPAFAIVVNELFLIVQEINKKKATT